MKTELCDHPQPHGAHRRWLAWRYCPGLILSSCGNPRPHGAHFSDLFPNEMCRGR